MSDRNQNGCPGKPTHQQRRAVRPGNTLSMHEGIAVWCDCCSCEAEDRWVEVGREMGIDLSDYERENPASGADTPSS